MKNRSTYWPLNPADTCVRPGTPQMACPGLARATGPERVQCFCRRLRPSLTQQIPSHATACWGFLLSRKHQTLTPAGILVS